MNPWDEISAALTDDLSGLATSAHGFGMRALMTPLVPAAFGRLLGIDAPRVAVPLICGATDAVAVRAFRDGDGWVLSGDLGAVPWGDAAGTLLVAAHTEPPLPADPLALFVVAAERPDIVRTARTSIGAHSMCQVHFAGVRIGQEALASTSWPAVVAALDKATIVAAAELAGLARGALDAAIAYATQREQFGAPIATYQALAHRLADMAIDADSAELAVEDAIAHPTPQNVSQAKIIANDVAHRAAAGLHQINGGVGFYADQLPPAYYARALALRVEMGDGRAHRLRLAAQLA